jgi:hypothetical protein
VDLEDLVMHLYCGQKNLKLVLTYTLFRDFNNGDFVIMKSHDLLFVIVWMGRTQSDVINHHQSEFFKIMKVQWRVLMKKGSNLDERLLYEDCWNGKWKCNLANSK